MQVLVLCLFLRKSVQDYQWFLNAHSKELFLLHHISKPGDIQLMTILSLLGRRNVHKLKHMKSPVTVNKNEFLDCAIFSNVMFLATTYITHNSVMNL